MTALSAMNSMTISQWTLSSLQVTLLIKLLKTQKQGRILAGFGAYSSSRECWGCAQQDTVSCDLQVAVCFKM